MGAGTVGPGGQMTPPGNLHGGQTWYFDDPRFFRKKYFPVHRSVNWQQNH